VSFTVYVIFTLEKIGVAALFGSFAPARCTSATGLPGFRHITNAMDRIIDPAGNMVILNPGRVVDAGSIDELMNRCDWQELSR
jgi:hypothetical protein